MTDEERAFFSRPHGHSDFHFQICPCGDTWKCGVKGCKSCAETELMIAKKKAEDPDYFI